MKFIWLPTQTRLFKSLSHYQSLWFRGEQVPEFWKEVVLALVDNKHNTETSRNGYPINIYQGRLSYEPYFIAINNRDQVIIGPNRKMVAIYVVRELEVLIWIHRDMNPKNRILLWLMFQECIMKMGREYDNMIGCAEVVLVSISCRRCWSLILSSCTITYLPHGICIVSSLYISIYNIGILLYLHALPIIIFLDSFSSLCLSVT